MDTFFAAQPMTVVIRLASAEFDTYIFLLNEYEQTVAEDDDSAGGWSSKVRYGLPYTGHYFVITNSLRERATLRCLLR